MKTTFKNQFLKNCALLFCSLFCFSLLSFSSNEKKSYLEETNILMEKQITIVITKKTTKEELEVIKKQMVDAGLGFKYSNVIYNDNNEIIAISIYYKDLNNNAGNYSVSSQNPINNIVIVAEGKGISIKSEGNSNQAFINQGSGDQNSAMKQRMEKMEKEMEERRQAMMERNAQREERILKQYAMQDFKGNPSLITKNTTDAELLELQHSYDAKNISFHYKNLSRNENNEITHISITIDNRNGSISTSGFGNGEETIKDITIAVDGQHTIMKNAE